MNSECFSEVLLLLFIKFPVRNCALNFLAYSSENVLSPLHNSLCYEVFSATGRFYCPSSLWIKMTPSHSVPWQAGKAQQKHTKSNTENSLLLLLIISTETIGSEKKQKTFSMVE